MYRSWMRGRSAGAGVHVGLPVRGTGGDQDDEGGHRERDGGERRHLGPRAPPAQPEPRGEERAGERDDGDGEDEPGEVPGDELDDDPRRRDREGVLVRVAPGEREGGGAGDRGEREQDEAGGRGAEQPVGSQPGQRPARRRARAVASEGGVGGDGHERRGEQHDELEPGQRCRGCRGRARPHLGASPASGSPRASPRSRTGRAGRRGSRSSRATRRASAARRRRARRRRALAAG